MFNITSDTYSEGRAAIVGQDIGQPSMEVSGSGTQQGLNTQEGTSTCDQSDPTSRNAHTSSGRVSLNLDR